jgi:hypothetical protein
MKFKTTLAVIAITVSFISCESKQAFSIDQCVGAYLCDVNAGTLLVLPSGRTDHPKPVPITGYAKSIVVNVEQTGESELTLTFEDRVMVAQVSPEGRLTIPNTDIYLENEYYEMPLTASYPAAYITSALLFIKQVADGVATCNDKGDRYTLTTTNTQFFEGEKQ